MLLKLLIKCHLAIAVYPRRFYSLYEERLLEVRQREEGDGVFKKPRGGRTNIMAAAEEAPMPEFTEAEVKEVCSALLEDITKYLSTGS